MIADNEIAQDVIHGSFKRSRSYHAGYATKSYGEIKALAASRPPDKKARQMKKLIEQSDRLTPKLNTRQGPR